MLKQTHGRLEANLIDISKEKKSIKERLKDSSQRSKEQKTTRREKTDERDLI